MPDYFMESEEEARRLDLKTDPGAVEEQALWAGVVPGMRVVDLGCGSGKTTRVLYELVQPGGEVVGVDFSQRRIKYAEQHHSGNGISYVLKDVRKSLSDLGQFDFVWVRFLLEYFEDASYEIVKNVYQLLKPGGAICLIDLDHNCLSHFGASQRLEKTLRDIVLSMQKRHGFDPYAGRKLYAYLYDVGCVDIEMRLSAHHLIYGTLAETDRFNWLLKAEAAKNASDLFVDAYPGGYREFYDELVKFLEHPRRFIYTPLIMCKGIRIKP